MLSNKMIPIIPKTKIKTPSIKLTFNKIKSVFKTNKKGKIAVLTS